jgi:hypothetical protein
MSDYVLFKFKKIDENLIDSLTKSYLYFASVQSLNDPFDCQIDTCASIASAIARCGIPEIREQLVVFKQSSDFRKAGDLAKVAGIFSSCIGKDNQTDILSGWNSHAMWSHYADNHNGVCLTYRFDEQWILENKDHLVAIDSVKYGESPLLDWFSSNEADSFTQPNLDDQFIEDPGIRLLMKSLTCKSPAWEYEHEARIIARKPGPYPILQSHLTQICFGLHTSQSDIDLIQRVCVNAGHPMIFSRMKRGGSDFGLTCEMMNQ